MSKKIILCLDGTDNQYKTDNSNVVKLYRVIKRIPNEQLVYYDPGVGTLADPHYKFPLFKKVNKYLGLAFAIGISKNIEEAYIYLMNNYEPNDQIYIFGFSRGAYTARVLAGFINACGLLEKGNESLLPYAMKLYKTYYRNKDSISKFKDIFGQKCEIKLLGLWDTVSTIGWIYKHHSFAYTNNNESVKSIRHALSIDEQRSFYQVILWGDEHKKKQNIKEVWFAGVHSDIGGGYPEEESGLSKISLEWMIREIQEKDFNIQIDQKKYENYILGKNINYVKANFLEKQHDSLTIPWKFVHILPYRKKENIKKVGIGYYKKYIRKIPKGSILHSSVLEKIKNGKYNPSNLKLSKIESYHIEH